MVEKALKPDLMQDSNGSVKAFESFHNVEKEKVESPSRRLEIENEKPRPSEN